jgi:8-oxo-dGTP pyrophosphatase MutT (NUDIX family)
MALMSTLDVLLRRRLSRAPVQVSPSPVLKWAAVAAILVPDPDALLLVRRADRAGDPWSGQMAMPGGRREPEEDLLFTALREAEEEVGIRIPPESLMGSLDDVAPRTPVLPPIAVRPFVFRLGQRPPLQLSAEVAEVHWVPLDLLRAPDTWGDVAVDVMGTRRVVPAYRLDAGTVWGMTERILTDLLRG